MPAVTFNPLDNITFANCLAAISVGNDFVSLKLGDLEEAGRHWFGPATETYQRILAKRERIGIDPSIETRRKSTTPPPHGGCYGPTSSACIRRPVPRADHLHPRCIARAMIVELLDDYGGQAASIETDAEVNPDRRAKLMQILLIAGLLPPAQVHAEMT